MVLIALPGAEDPAGQRDGRPVRHIPHRRVVLICVWDERCTEESGAITHNSAKSSAVFVARNV